MNPIVAIIVVFMVIAICIFVTAAILYGIRWDDDWLFRGVTNREKKTRKGLHSNGDNLSVRLGHDGLINETMLTRSALRKRRAMSSEEMTKEILKELFTPDDLREPVCSQKMKKKSVFQRIKSNFVVVMPTDEDES